LNYIVRLLIVSVALLTGTQVLTAQQPDIRLSTEPTSSTLPAEIQIQSAATIGNRTLVVWGSGALGSKGEFRPILRMQMLEGNQLYGEQHTIHSDEARPYSLVRIFPTRDRFLVFWNDARLQPSLYVSVVDTSGKVEAEVQFTVGIAATGNDLQFLSLDDGGGAIIANITRNDSTTLVYQTLSSDGQISSDMKVITGEPFAQILRYSLLPGMVILRRTKDSAIVMYSSGRLDTRKIPAARFQQAFHISGDSSLATIDDTLLTIYSSLFDQQPSRVIKIPSKVILIPTTSDPIPVSGTRFLWRDDTLGPYQMIYVARVPDPQGAFSVAFELRRQFLKSNDSFSVADKLGSVEHYATEYDFIAFEQANRVFRCDNALQFHIRVNLTTNSPNQPASSQFEFDSLAYPEGVFKTTSKYSSNPQPPKIIIQPCDPSYMPVVIRRIIAGESTVDVMIGSDSITVQHVLPEQLNTIVQTKPVIILQGDELMVTWKVASSPFDTQFLYQWSGGNVISLDSESLSASYSRESLSYSWGATNVHPAVGASAIVHSLYTCDVPSSNELARLRSLISISLPVSHRWATVLTLQEYAGGGGRYVQEGTPWISLKEFVADPERNEVLACVLSSKTSRVWLLAFNSTGEIVWQDTSASSAVLATAETRALVPISSHRVLFVGESGIITIENGVIVNSTPLSSPLSAHYIPLLGENFLRYYPDSSNNRHYTFDIIDLNGTIVHHADIHLDVDPFDLTIAQRPGDSSLYILYSSSSGVHATILSSNLEVQRQHRQISAGTDSTRNPSAVFIKDYLVVAWEDYRNGVADIYGKIRSAEAILSTEAVAGDDGSGEMTVSPNPVRDLLRIELPESMDRALLELYDPMGRQVLSRELDNAAHSKTLDLSSIASGMYLLVVRTGDKVRHQQIVVVH
jgi:hypothetical protein